MPNPKVGTVTPDVAGAVKRAKAGQVAFRVDKAGVVHCRVGHVKFTPDQLKENIEAVLVDIKKLRPSEAKGIYMRKLSISTTMGAGLAVDLTSVNI
jgi:large subunit ribosomal protein L1